MRHQTSNILLLLAAVGVLAGASCTPQKNVGGLVGVSMPDFSLESYDKPGTFVTPDQFKGKVILINFWNTLSEPCREAMPFIDSLYTKYGEKGLEVMAVTTETRKQVDNFKLDTGYEYPIYLDKDGKFLQAMRIYAIPSVVIVARNGVIQREGHPNEQNLVLEALDAAIVEGS